MFSCVSLCLEALVCEACAAACWDFCAVPLLLLTSVTFCTALACHMGAEGTCLVLNLFQCRRNESAHTIL